MHIKTKVQPGQYFDIGQKNNGGKNDKGNRPYQHVSFLVIPFYNRRQHKNKFKIKKNKRKGRKVHAKKRRGFALYFFFAVLIKPAKAH